MTSIKNPQHFTEGFLLYHGITSGFLNKKDALQVSLL